MKLMHKEGTNPEDEKWTDPPSLEKKEGSPGTPSFPHSLTFPSGLFFFLSSLPHSFFLFTISCFILFYFAGGHLGCR